MKRLKTVHEYHDSHLMRAEWLNKSDLQLFFDLDGHWNENGEFASIIFYGIRNPDDVIEGLEKITKNRTHNEWMADVVAFVKESKTTYLIDASQGSLIIDAKSYVEI